MSSQDERLPSRFSCPDCGQWFDADDTIHTCSPRAPVPSNPIDVLRARFDNPSLGPNDWKRSHTEALFNEIERLQRELAEARDLIAAACGDGDEVVRRLHTKLERVRAICVDTSVAPVDRIADIREALAAPPVETESGAPRREAGDRPGPLVSRQSPARDRCPYCAQHEEIERLRRELDEAADLLCEARPSENMESASADEWYEQANAWHCRRGRAAFEAPPADLESAKLYAADIRQRIPEGKRIVWQAQLVVMLAEIERLQAEIWERDEALDAAREIAKRQPAEEIGRLRAAAEYAYSIWSQAQEDCSIADRMADVLNAALAGSPVETSEGQYLVRAFWSPERKYLVNVHVTAPKDAPVNIIGFQDDNGVQWEPAGAQENMSHE